MVRCRRPRLTRVGGIARARAPSSWLALGPARLTPRHRVIRAAAMVRRHLVPAGRLAIPGRVLAGAPRPRLAEAVLGACRVRRAARREAGREARGAGGLRSTGRWSVSLAGAMTVGAV